MLSDLSDLLDDYYFDPVYELQCIQDDDIIQQSYNRYNDKEYSDDSESQSPE
jgi:hypothetical protein